MIKLIDKTKCCGCSACVNACPKQCITMEQDEEGFLYPKVNESDCVNCGLCDSVCPFEKTEPARLLKPISYAVKIKDSETREKSSSGGVFSVLANAILSQNGVVYGAAMSGDNKSVRHIRVDSNDGLEVLRTSKYLQSETTDVYKQVLKDLNVGKKVLFSGVPCQINGLRLFLRKEYENLICIEVICHGVPSPALWKKYVEYLENKYKSDVQRVNFRSKKHGWKNFGLEVKGDITTQYKSIEDDPYMKMFLRDYCLRPSCYDCNAKKLESMADLTIADFWGISNVIPKFNDDRGVSLVLLQSQKGINIFNDVKNQTEYCEVDFDKAIKCNPAYAVSAKRPTQRDTFFIDMNVLNFRALEKKYVEDSFKRKCKKLIKRSFLWKIFVKITRRGGVNHKSFEYGLMIIFNRK